MIAYVFDHRPRAGSDLLAYVAALAGFHQILAEDPPAGFERSWIWRVSAGPVGPGFEDWYLLEDWAALGALNAAVRERVTEPLHARVAALSGAGSGAVYELAHGSPAAEQARRVRLAKPRGVPAGEFVARLAEVAEPGVIWQRQMVLGTDSEYLIDLPVGPLEHRISTAKASPLTRLYPPLS